MAMKAPYTPVSRGLMHE